jgi:hypothetical protein
MLSLRNILSRLNDLFERDRMLRKLSMTADSKHISDVYEIREPKDNEAKSVFIGGSTPTQSLPVACSKYHTPRG